MSYSRRHYENDYMSFEAYQRKLAFIDQFHFQQDTRRQSIRNLPF